MRARAVQIRRGTPTRAGAWLLATTLVFGASSAGAQDDAARLAARDLAAEGVALLKEGEYAEAQVKLRRGWDLYPMPTVALFEGEALEKLGKLVQAAERYQAAKLAELPDTAHSALRTAVERAGQELDRITPLIPGVVIELRGAEATTPGLEIQLDGAPVKPAMLGLRRPVNPGGHEIVALYQGQVQARERVTLQPSQTETVLLELSLPARRSEPSGFSGSESEPPPAGASATLEDRGSGGFPQRTIGWVSLGVGAAGLATGVVGGSLMMGKDSTLEDGCPNDRCPPELQDDLDAFTTWRTVSLVGYGVGIVGLGAGAVLLLTAPSDPGPAAAVGLAPVVGLGHIGLVGRF